MLLRTSELLMGREELREKMKPAQRRLQEEGDNI
jgi:hypothetical protein